MKYYFLIFISSFLTINSTGQTKTGYLTKDGGWCWFSDPRAIVVDNNIITGWVKSDGTVEAAKFNLNTTTKKLQNLYYKLEKDDHNNPAFVKTGKNEVLAMYTRHSKKDLFINFLKDYNSNDEFKEPQLIHPISKSELKKFPQDKVTYANPYLLKSENNKLYCFGRWTGYKPNIMWSEDDGYTWSKSKVFITNYPFKKNNRPYVKYFSDGNSKIHFVFTDGHPRIEAKNSVYYGYYEKGAFYKADGTQISTIETIPFEPKEASIVFTSNEKEGRAWIADIGQDEKGNPVLLYTKSPSENNHEYWYATYSKNGWKNIKLCDSGKWFPKTQKGKKEREPHYFGGLTIHPDNSNIIYLSRQIKGVFEIERWETPDNGNTWIKEQITKNSTLDNVRPYIPRILSKDSKEVVLWMENQNYIHYEDYKSAIKYQIRNK